MMTVSFAVAASTRTIVIALSIDAVDDVEMRYSSVSFCSHVMIDSFTG